ncbi:glycosyltransferase [Candidatus Saccharibacteria bacterium]|nr:glycosyltransferase [Candidatus Saccharibacteria bacterium]
MKKVLYVVEDTDSAQFRYRVKNIAEALKSSFGWKVGWVLKSEIEKVELSQVDLVVILRQTAKDKKILDFIDLVHRNRLKVLFDLDDLIFDYRDLPILMRGTNSRNAVYWMGYIWGIRRIAKRVDGFITTNGFLAKKLKRSFKKKCAVIHNSLNKEQVEISEKCLREKTHDGFVIGYFSGSPTHSKDLKMIENQLVSFLDSHRDVSFLLVGYMELSKTMQELLKTKRMSLMKPVDYLELLKKEAVVDINIAPLVVNEFTNCKSELKFFEAAVVETTTIASPVYTFKKAILDGKTGFLAEPGEWYDKMEYLYKNPSESRKIAKAARQYVLENYYGEKFLKEVEKAYEVLV